MRATVFHGTRDVRVEEVPDAALREPTDALVRVTHACICGSDLWPYRGEILIYSSHGRMGHEFMGVVEAVGPEVATVRPGDRVIAPFAFSDGACEFCAAGLHTSCVSGGYWGGAQNDGGQGEAVRVPLADGTLVPLPGGTVGHVGVPAESVGLMDVYNRNISLRGGVAPVRAYIPDLLADVLAGRPDPSPVLDMTVPLDRVPDGYAAMDERRAITVLVEV